MFAIQSNKISFWDDNICLPYKVTKISFWDDNIWLHREQRVIPDKTIVLLQNMAAGCAPFRALGRRERDCDMYCGRQGVLCAPE